jgi:5-methylcytosine-specific restriction endonuclease McrA
LRIAWNKGLTKETDERVRKNSESKTGFHHTEETKNKLSEINRGHIPINVWGKGHIPWNKGIKGGVSWNKGLTKNTDERVKKYGEKQQGKCLSKETKQRISSSKKGKVTLNKGKKLSIKHRENLSKAHKGIKLSENHKRNISKSLRGENCWNWKGGISSLTNIIRKNCLYRQWRDDIFTRDDFTCQKCGVRGKKLNAHHIKSFSSILQFYEITSIEEALECDELWNINNGITLCKKCHYKLRGDEDEYD